jgi:hypothetical protein
MLTKESPLSDLCPVIDSINALIDQGGDTVVEGWKTRELKLRAELSTLYHLLELCGEQTSPTVNKCYFSPDKKPGSIYPLRSAYFEYNRAIPGLEMFCRSPQGFSIVSIKPERALRGADLIWQAQDVDITFEGDGLDEGNQTRITIHKGLVSSSAVGQPV